MLWKCFVSMDMITTQAGLLALLASQQVKRRKQIFINRFLLCISIFVILFVLVKTYSSKNSIAYNYKEEYLEDTKYLAIKTARKYDLYPSVILAQSALESGYGISELSSKYNNYFGIKRKIFIL